MARDFLETGWNVVLNGRNVDSAHGSGAGRQGRVGDAHDISAAVRYLAEASFVSGHILNVDGGYVTGRR
jgi:hypothetical protein